MLFLHVWPHGARCGSPRPCLPTQSASIYECIDANSGSVDNGFCILGLAGPLCGRGGQSARVQQGDHRMHHRGCAPDRTSLPRVGQYSGVCRHHRLCGRQNAASRMSGGYLCLRGTTTCLPARSKVTSGGRHGCAHVARCPTAHQQHPVPHRHQRPGRHSHPGRYRWLGLVAADERRLRC